MWTTLSSDTHESLFLKTLRDAFGVSDKFKDKFAHFVSTGPVYIDRGCTLVLDSTATALAGLPTTTQDTAKDSDNDKGSSSSCVRQHRRTVLRWAGNMISAAANPSQVVIAIADAMVALNAAYVKCKLLHGNLSDRAIQLQETADGIRGRLVGPEVRGMRSREYALAPFNRLDDWECILYIICVLGTFGINQADRNEYPAGESWFPQIKSWNSGDAAHVTEIKRLHMDSALNFFDTIASKMDDGPLCRLAVDIHRIIFLHPECHGAMVSLKGVDPLVARNNFEDAIVTALLALMEEYRRKALLALQAQPNVVARSMAEQSTGPLKKHKRNVTP
ncbi:hypothetical protein GGH94_005673 [Coemansia aciculifera]|uniref:Fungal-type protein kinase domain-containing protein n=1 Tax=Coemansia aciculifera TaxID=417176 RepID=A0A9W8M2F3_9FUNG|nr:hypothetical protein GGH94_005673 [Coemansia aciculifera]